jgi:hypothetical protein
MLVDQDSKDPTGGHWINQKNISEQRGALVLEPVCEKAVTQQDAIQACRGYQNPIKVPAPGARITAVGYWVLDRAHGWRELHPWVEVA